MGIASSAGNIFFVYQFIKRLVTPFENTDAYKLGIIDEKGKVLRKRSTLKTKEEKEAYTISDTMVFNLKKILAKVPGGGTKFGTFTAALFLIKEQETRDAKLHYDQTYLEKEFASFLQECRYNKKEMKQLIEEVEHRAEELDEEGLAAGGGGIAGLGVDNPSKPGQAEPGVRRKKKKFAGSEVFLVKPEVYMRARFGKKRYGKYENYVGNDETGEAIRQYGRSNPGKPIILQDELTGGMIYLKYGREHARLHNI